MKDRCAFTEAFTRRGVKPVVAYNPVRDFSRVSALPFVASCCATEDRLGGQRGLLTATSSIIYLPLVVNTQAARETNGSPYFNSRRYW